MSISEDYISKITKAFNAGNATEHTHRPALKDLIESLVTGIVATNEPSRVQCGAPDYIISKGNTPLGYIEAKDIGKSLSETEKSEQLTRYLESLGNLILTDYLEFRWYVDGKHRLTARLASVVNGKIKVEKDGPEKVLELLNAFLNAKATTVKSPKELAVRMAALAKLIKDIIQRAFNEEDLTDNEPDPLHDQLEGFRKVLIHDLTPGKFADMYSQTICYGLFAAKCNADPKEHFTRQHASYDLPKTNPFLRKMFNYIAGPELDDRVVWAVDDVAELLNHTDIEAILKDFGKRTKQEDPVVHFYESFLAAYDSNIREARGVYYTPEPVVSYIVKSIDHILKTTFKLHDGLADSSKIKVSVPGTKKHEVEVHKVQILDPATGTGTFLHGVVDQIYETFESNKGMWSGYVHEHLLPRLFGFEYLMAPYAVAHMKLGLQLKELGYDFKSTERIRIYLTNTLDEAHAMTGLPLFTQWITEEANAASDIKKDAPVMVVLGNPPYKLPSINPGFVKPIQNNYYPNDSIKESNPGVLLNDYVKFIRFAQERIERTGYGILAFITSHAYLSNPVYRRMRQSLMDTFDDIYLLDLHGNVNKKEKSLDGSKDEGVFDIQEGVAIGIFVRKTKSSKKTCYHSDIYGLRKDKYKWLSANDVSSTNWEELDPTGQFYLFTLQDKDVEQEFNEGWKLSDLFKVNGNGIKTRKDKLLIDFTRDDVHKRFKDIISLSSKEAIEKYNIKTNDDWDFAEVHSKLDHAIEDKIIKVLYRPYDTRAMYYNKIMIERGDHRYPIMQHMLNGVNLGLVSTRQVTGLEFNHTLCSRNVIEMKTCSHDRGTNLFPLYTYPVNTDNGILFDDLTHGCKSNLTPKFVDEFSIKLKMKFVQFGKGDLKHTFGPENIFDYIYAVLHSSTYRSRYAKQLKVDYARIPSSSNLELFNSLCLLGDDLVALHLMEKHVTKITSYPVAGDSTVYKVHYDEPSEGVKGRIWINKTQYFEGVPKAVWGFHVGGYQVCDKWLKDRKGRQLTYDELTHYQNVIATLAETLHLMTKIDETIDAFGGWPIK